MVIGDDGICQLERWLNEIDAAEQEYKDHLQASDAFCEGRSKEAPPGGLERMEELTKKVQIAQAKLEGTLRGLIARERSREDRLSGTPVARAKRRTC
jgi:hypothetical protein